MSITLVGTPTSGVDAFSASKVVNKPVGVADGDLLLTQINGYGTALGPATPDTPAGWTLVGVNKSAGLVGNIALGFYFRYASGEPASYTFSNDDSSGLHYIAAGIVALRGAAAVSPFEVASVAAHATGNAFTSADPGSSTDDNCWFMLFASSFDGITGTPGDMVTDLAYDGSPTANWIGHRVIHPAGATGTRAFTTNFTDDSSVWACIIKPLVAGNATNWFSGMARRVI